MYGVFVRLPVLELKNWAGQEQDRNKKGKMSTEIWI
jgi:hypothetical protein